MDLQDPTARLTCPRCRSRLDVWEMQSGARTVSVKGLGDAVGSTAKALEIFIGADAGPEISCPACTHKFDPAAPYRGESRGSTDGQGERLRP